jgi:hypothetical protein
MPPFPKVVLPTRSGQRRGCGARWFKRSSRNMARHAKRLSVRVRIERKIRVLEMWLKRGVPPRVLPPTSLRQFATWADPALELEAIRSPNEITRTGRHGALVRRAELLIARHKALSQERHPARKRDRLTKMSEALDLARAQISALTSRLHEVAENAERLAFDNAHNCQLLRERDERIADFERLLKNWSRHLKRGDN